ncbi:hypothetical protein P886_3401 [Alteromonadaceae bacterium 2753L.S.0a.02]|nr:hypothetical protein P886_3401 [Alteromonadaceae bacterium 2753L.S.0a.02]
MIESYQKAIRTWSLLKRKGWLIPSLNVDPSEIIHNDRLHDLIFSEYEKRIQQENEIAELERKLELARVAEESKYNDIEKRLLNLLGSIAGYNDKGWQWSNHDAEKRRSAQDEFGAELQKLLNEFGERKLTKKALELFNSDAVVKDCNGEYKHSAKELLSKGCFYA